MALSMDEQRILAEIEKRLAADDPGLASCLTTFRRPGPGTVLRSPRARIIGSLFTVLLVAMVSLMVYAMIPFRAHTVRNNVTPTAQAPSNPGISAPHTHSPGTQQATASASATSGSSIVASSPNRPAGRSSSPASSGAASARALGASGAPTDAKAKPASSSAAPTTSP
jgi:cytoskeletal protein RodZ